ncbi:hypothetical protein NUACC21_45830 [Scytonema sp. NUACC21]
MNTIAKLLLFTTFTIFIVICGFTFSQNIGYAENLTTNPPINAQKLEQQLDISLSPNIPADVTITKGANTLEILQHDFDVFSWQSFIALNWPALPNGSPNIDEIIGIGGDRTTVWENYKEAYTIFPSDGQKPASWETEPVIPLACQSQATNGEPVFRMMQKVTDEVLDASNQAFKSGPLIDRQGQYVRYAIHANKETFDYIQTNNLYNKVGQENFTFQVDFPSGNNNTQEIGSIILKSAWKILSPNDEPKRFHTINALVYTPASTVPEVEETCQRKTLGLVGFHISHKTKSSPQWIWSTFEHVDNLEVPSGSGLKPLFYNPDYKAPVNVPPPKPWNPNLPAPPTQVKRIIPIDEATKALNHQWQEKLKNINPDSVWQYYELISTQWPTARKASLTGNPAPQFLANSTLETYNQGRVPNVSSSCIQCHLNATTTNGKFSDFTYLLERAK